MAGDWIKIELTTPSKPEVDVLAELLDIPVNEVIGGLVRLWIWADQQTIDGNAASVTKNAIDRHSGVTGLASAMLDERVGWLIAREEGGFCFPNFERHNGQTAKQRALTAKRVACHKKRKGNDASVTQPLPREEKRREENINTPYSPPDDETAEPGPKPKSRLDEQAEAIYQAYPRKAGRGTAIQRIKQAFALATAEELLEAVQAYARATEAWPPEDKQFIPHPATWFHQQRWMDDRSTWAAKQRGSPRDNSPQAKSERSRQAMINAGKKLYEEMEAHNERQKANPDGVSGFLPDDAQAGGNGLL